MNPNHTGGDVPWKTLVALWVVYFFSASGRIAIADSAFMLDLTRSLLSGSIAVSPSAERLVGADGQTYCHYGLLTSLWWMPFVFVGRLMARFFPIIPASQWEEFTVSFAGGFVVVLLLVYQDWAWRLRGMKARQRRWGLWALGMSTVLWPYAKISMSDPIMALCLFAAYVHWRASERPAQALAAGIWLGLALLSRKQAQSLLPILLLYFCWQSRGAGGRRRLAFVGWGLLPALLVQLAYNQARGGNPLVERYAGAAFGMLGPMEFLRRSAGLLFNGESGLFTYSPLLLLWLVGGVEGWWKRDRAEVLLIAAMLAGQMVLLSPQPYWDGPLTFGSRYLLFLVPFLGLSWGAWEWPLRRARRWLMIGGVAVGTSIAALGVTTDTLATCWRREIYLSNHHWLLPVYGAELARTLGVDRTPPPQDKPFANIYWNHPAFQVPDVWWWHLGHQLFNPRPAGKSKDSNAPTDKPLAPVAP